MPAFNEEEQIAKLVLQAKQHVDTVVVVDDGSTDMTAAIAQRLGAHVAHHAKNKGYGAALRTCFKTARELDADIMVILDSDGQHDPAYILQFIEALVSFIKGTLMPHMAPVLGTRPEIIKMSRVNRACEYQAERYKGHRKVKCTLLPSS
jgi:glycosyltransferase involved in cell wall biosynthesis